MEHYIQQLIEDLNHVAGNPPEKPWIEPPPNLADDPVVAELALVPFKSIEEWTGIKMEAFPDMMDLTTDQCQQLNEAIFRVYRSLNLMLIDLPEGIPEDVLYDILSSNWDHPVQYLPSSGMDVELCTGNPYICPYGELCDCGWSLDFDISDIPEKYREVVKKIAENNDCGYVCFFNPETGEMEEAMPEWLEDHGSLEDAVDQEWEEMYTFENWKQIVTIEPPEPHESFRIMEDFADNKATGKLQQQLREALDRRKPFRNFKHIIDQSDSRQDWFDYKQKMLEERDWTLISRELPNEVDHDALPF